LATTIADDSDIATDLIAEKIHPGIDLNKTAAFGSAARGPRHPRECDHLFAQYRMRGDFLRCREARA
jgi:hypothetical protein